MAKEDQQDPQAGGDWWTQNAPPTASGPSFDQVNADYQELLGRPLSQEEYQQYWANRTDYNRTMVANSAEGIAYLNKQHPEYSGQPAVVTPPPVTPGTSTGGTPAPLGLPTSGFGAAPPPYVSDPNAPVYTPMPDYVPPVWTGGDYQNPTIEDLQNSPGYQARLDRLIKTEGRRYAAQGTILNGGTLQALDRSAQDYASNEYQNLRNNTYQAYVDKYKRFTDAAGMDLNARTINANENQNTYANRTAAYLTGNARTLSDYLTNVTAKRNAEMDYWQRLQDVNNTGANLAGGSR